MIDEMAMWAKIAEIRDSCAKRNRPARAAVAEYLRDNLTPSERRRIFYVEDPEQAAGFATARSA